MSNEEKILEMLGNMQKDIKEIKGDIKELKTHQNYIWDDIKKLDKRISDNTAEINVLKRA